MNYTELAKYFRLLGCQVEETGHGVWYGVGHGFFTRVPPYEVTLPSRDVIQTLFRRYPLIGLKYSVAQGGRGKAGGVYFVRDPDYDFKNLQSRMRSKTRRGLENCQVREVSFEELHRLGMPLNRDTLTRQQRDDSLFDRPNGWKRFCTAGEAVEGAEVWGAFVGGELAVYAVLFRLGKVVNIVHQMSRTRLMDLNVNPALNFAMTRAMMRTPGIEAVCFGPEGISSSGGLDKYKQHMGFQKEPVVFAVRLRPLVRCALLNRVSLQAIAALGRWRPQSDFYRRVQGVLDIATLS